MSFNALKRLGRLLPIYRELLDVGESLWGLRKELGDLRAMQADQYAALLLQGSERYRDPLRLHRNAGQTNSQNGEDGMIAEIFARIGITDRSFVEIGIGDGLENNSAALLAQGWSGLWIDGSREFLARGDELGRWGDALRHEVAFVSRENIAEILLRHRVPREIDLLAVDIDMNTYHVWDALSEWRPRVVVVEYNASILPAIEWVVPYTASSIWDGSARYGASLKSFELLGQRLGYALIGCDMAGVNAFFVREDLAGHRFAAPFDAQNHYEPPRYWLSARAGHRRAVLDRYSSAAVGAAG
jgi:hypothetical protein